MSWKLLQSNVQFDSKQIDKYVKSVCFEILLDILDFKFRPGIIHW